MLSPEEKSRQHNALKAGGQHARAVILALLLLRGKPYLKAEAVVHPSNLPGLWHIRTGLKLVFGPDYAGHPKAGTVDEGAALAWFGRVT